MKTLTVFTPAYNRAHTIGRTYESLLRQTCKDFEWLVLDDGSTDNTRELVEGWIAEGKIPIRYVWQENQGMHGAHNCAYANIETELNVCIDSDDLMPDDAVEKIVSFWKNNYRDEDKDRIAGIIGLDADLSGNVLGAEFPEGLKETTLRDYYELLGGSGDKKLVYRTEVVKKYPPYPLFEGERYVGLALLYNMVDEDYKLLVCNQIMCNVDYQPEGSSFSMWKQYWNNPKGFAFFSQVRYAARQNLQAEVYAQRSLCEPFHPQPQQEVPEGFAEETDDFPGYSFRMGALSGQPPQGQEGCTV